VTRHACTWPLGTLKLDLELTWGGLRVSLCTEQEKDEIRFMKGWKLKELEKIMPAWQRRQCEEIKRERWRGF
jgi:hypothetical protein